MKRLFLLAILLAACNRSEVATPTTSAAPPPPAAAGNAERGKQVAVQFGCGVCHVIPGIEGAEGALGPALAGVASRPAISDGVVPNTPDNLTRYIVRPASMNPQSRMPPMGVSQAEAQDITAFLMTLK